MSISLFNSFNKPQVKTEVAGTIAKAPVAKTEVAGIIACSTPTTGLCSSGASSSGCSFSAVA